MKTIIFIGTQKSGSSREAIQAAQKMGYYTILLTNISKQIQQRFEYSDVHLMRFCNFDNYHELKEMIRHFQLSGLKIMAIVSFTNGLCYLANKLAADFDLNHFSVEAIYKMENKIESRKSIANTEYCPKFLLLEPKVTYLEKDVKFLFPAIMKAPSSAGSKDVYKIHNYDEFTKYLNRLHKRFPYQQIILEEYLDGPQLITEVLVYDKKVVIVGVIEQEISFINDHFIVTGYYLQINKPYYYAKLHKAVSDIIHLHGMTFGACHLELRLVKGKWKLVEINPRISGGGMNELIELGTGINLVKQTLNLVLKQDVNIVQQFQKHVYAQYAVVYEEGILEKITGVNKVKNSENILSVYIKPRKGNIISPPLSMGNRYAYVIATRSNQHEAEQNAKKAISEITFHLKKG